MSISSWNQAVSFICVVTLVRCGMGHSGVGVRRLKCVASTIQELPLTVYHLKESHSKFDLL